MILPLRTYKATSTHMPLLIKYIQKTKGNVLEMGSGVFSTPLIHWLLLNTDRKIFTYESDEEYYRYAKQFQSKNHIIRFVKDWDKVDVNKDWSVVLIDHVQFRRTKDAIRVKDNAEYVLLHDTERPWTYEYDKVWSHFKYIKKYDFCKPNTTVISNINKL